MSKKKSLPEHNLKVYAGDDFTLPMRWKINGSVVDITGYTAIFTVSRDKGQDVPDLQLTVGSGIVIDAPTQGSIVVSLTDTQTGDLDGFYNYDLKLTSGAGVDQTILLGLLEVVART